jgi:hypothetical protein
MLHEVVGDDAVVLLFVVDRVHKTRPGKIDGHITYEVAGL